MAVARPAQQITLPLFGNGTLVCWPDEAVSIQVGPANSSAPLGHMQQFTATGMFSNGSTQDLTNTVDWSSLASAVAAISPTRLASSKGQGSTTILATSGNISGSVTWTVTPPILLSIAVTPANASTPRGSNQQFTVMGTFENGSSQDITGSVVWTSSQLSVVTITSAGVATGVTTGNVTITAASGEVGDSISVTVTPPFNGGGQRIGICDQCQHRSAHRGRLNLAWLAAVPNR